MIFSRWTRYCHCSAAIIYSLSGWDKNGVKFKKIWTEENRLKTCNWKWNEKKWFSVSSSSNRAQQSNLIYRWIAVSSLVTGKPVTRNNWLSSLVMKFVDGISARFNCSHTFTGIYVIETFQPSDFINVLSQKFIKMQQPFDLSLVQGVSNECRMHSQKFVESLRNFEMWALKCKFLSIKKL